MCRQKSMWHFALQTTVRVFPKCVYSHCRRQMSVILFPSTMSDYGCLPQLHIQQPFRTTTWPVDYVIQWYMRVGALPHFLLSICAFFNMFPKQHTRWGCTTARSDCHSDFNSYNAFIFGNMQWLPFTLLKSLMSMTCNNRYGLDVRWFV
jgi:hypothetical protein